MKLSGVKWTICFLTLLAVFGCKKYKKPTQVVFYAKTSSTNLFNNRLVFSGGEISAEEFGFSGERKKGDDVDFEKQFDDGALMLLNDLTNSHALFFDIPQGEYTQIEVKLKLDQQQNEYALLLLGNYENLAGDIFNVRFELTDEQVFEWKGKNELNDSEVVFDADKLTQAKFSFNLNYWFEAIPESSFETASITNINGVNTIVINKDENTGIYDAVINRIDDSNELIFTY